MNLRDLGIDERIVEIFKKQGIEELYPPQEEAVGPCLRGDNLVLAMPTASGKSLVAYLAVLKSILKGGKAMYIVPLRALASEKYEDLRAFEPLGIKVGIATGDYDTPDPMLERYDIIVATSEKADSLLRHRTHWLEQLTVVIADEIHLINDADRGPTLEVTLSKMRQVNPGAQILALSATIKNSQDLADWLKAKHIRSDWRPVPLKEGIFLDGRISFLNDSPKEIEMRGDEIHSLVEDVVKEGGQSLIFVNTRRSSEALAKSLTSAVKPYLSEADLRELNKIAETLLKRQEEPTSMAARLARCLKSGVAFHNAGLTNEQRKLIEENFRGGKIKCIAATPTLAAGINLPARRVIIRDLRRFDVNLGFVPIPVLEIKQMAGRAGRPQYDDFGEAVLIAKKEADREFILENYLLKETEGIESKLGREPALRMHILASIATGHVQSKEELFKFIGSTFFAHKGEVQTIDTQIKDVLNFLREEELITSENGLKATFFGKRTSDLYIDPLSAVILRDALKSKGDGAFSYLHAICATPDMPKLYLRRRDYEWVESKVGEVEILLPIQDYDFFLAEVKTATFFEDWIEEETEDVITKRYGIGPGDIRRMVEMGEWLLYSMQELAKIFNKNRLRDLMKLVPRIHYGVKEELLELVSLRGIGRVRGRALFQKGFHSLKDLQKAEEMDIAKVPTVGLAIARNIKKQLGGREEVKEAEEETEGQSMLADFE